MALPSPSALPAVFDECKTTRDGALILDLTTADSPVRYVLYGYVARVPHRKTDPLDFSVGTLTRILFRLGRCC